MSGSPGRLRQALALLGACAAVAGASQGVAGATALHHFVAATTPVTELPPGSVQIAPDSVQPPDGITSLPSSPKLPEAPSVRVLARSSNGVSPPGGAAPFFVVVSNSGAQPTTAGEPVVLTIHVPAGLDFAGVTDLDRTPGFVGFPSEGRSSPGTTWLCRGAGEVRCEYGRRSPRGAILPEPLPARTTSALFVRFDVAQAFQAKEHGSLLRVGFALSAPGNTAETDTSQHADVTVASDLTRPQVFPDVGGTEMVERGVQATEIVELLNAGSGPATSIALSDLLPASLLGSWRSAGTGWNCSGTVPTCSYSGTVPVGRLTPRLMLTYTLDDRKVDALQLPIGGASHVEAWTIAIDARGASAASPASFPARIAVGAPQGSTLMPELIVADGIDELLPGASTTLDVTLTNLGKAATTGKVVLHGTMPAGIEVTGAFERGVGGTRQWPCSAQPLGDKLQELTCTSEAAIPAARSIQLALPVKAAAGAHPGAGAVTLGARADNQLEGAEAKTAAVPLIVLPGDAGFPALTLSHATGPAADALALVPATDGAPAALLTGDHFAEHFDVRDAGGAPIAAGTEADLEQLLGAGVEVRSIRAPAGWSCGSTAGPRLGLHCTFRFADELAPATSIPGPTVIVVPTEPTPPATNWPASVRLLSSAAPKATHLPVLVSVTRALPRLLPDIRTEVVPTAGGAGRFSVAVSNIGDASTRSDVHLSLHLPHGVTLGTVTAPSWRCTPAATSAVCVSSAPEARGAQLAPVVFTAAFAPGTARKNLTIVARAGDGSASVPKSAVAAATVAPRSGLRAMIKAPDTVAFVDEPLVDPDAPLTRSSLTLEGDGSGGSGMGVSYTWIQRCTTSADVSASRGRCSGVTPQVRWIDQPAGTLRPTTADVAFTVPMVTRLTALVFELTVSDGSATASAFKRVRVVPDTPASAGFSFDHAHPVKLPAAGPVTEHRRLPLPAERLRVKPKPRKAQTDIRVVAADTFDTTTTTTTTAAAPLAGAFCDLVRDAANGKSSFSQAFGPVSLHFTGVKLSGTGCAADTTFSFADSSLAFGSYLRATGLAGSVSKDGISLTAGTFEGPQAWHAPAFTVGGKGLSLPFGSGSSVEIDGSVTGEGLAFVPLPSGWSGTTTLAFEVAGGSTSVSLSAEGKGPAREASPDSAPPSLALDGAIANDGSFSLSASLERLVELQGHSLDVTGHVSRGAEGPVEVKLSGTLNGGFDIVPGLHVESLSVTMAPTHESLGLSGEGTILLKTASSSFGVGVKLAYDDPRNWSLTADGAGTVSWTPLPGLTIAPSDVHGAITAKHDKYEFSLRLTPAGTWSPTTAVDISKLELALSNTCEDTGAPCPKDAAVFLHVKGDAEFRLPTVGSVATSLRGVLALPSGEFSVAATLPRAIDIGPGISIDTGKIELSHGMPTQEGMALLAGSAEPGGLQLAISGSATLPHLGKIPVIEAAFTSKGWSIAAQLGSFSLPGASGDGSKLGDTIVGWSSYPTSLKVVDPVTNAVSKIDLPANSFKVSGSFATPPWLKDMLKLPGDLHGRATGSLDLTSGEFGLRMELEFPQASYLYGGANTASSVLMSTAHFEIARKSGEFSLALGGKAKLAVAATKELPASHVDLTVALGFSAATQTVAGELILESAAGWQSAFGVKDLTLHDLAIAFQLNLSTLTPGLGFGARAVLPAAIRDPLGIPNGAKTTLVANISVTNPCIGIEIDPATPGSNVLDIAGKGVLTAKEFEVEIAPAGCTVGQFHYDPGLSVAFDGTIAGVDVAVAAHLGLVPFALDAKIDIGEFAIGGLSVQKTQIELAASSKQIAIRFAGGVSVLGTTVQLSGGLEQAGATTKIDFRGTLDKLSLGNAVTIKSVLVDARVEVGPRPTLKFAAKGSIDLLGSNAEAEFALGLDNGALIRAQAKVKAKVVVGGSSGLTLDGIFNLDYEPSKALAIDASVQASVGSFQLGNAAVSVRPHSLELTGNLNVGGVFKATIAGAAYFGDVPKGTQITGPGGGKVAAKAGDFLLSAKDVTLNLGGFTAIGTVELGRANAQVWGNVAAAIQLLGTGSDNSVVVAGSFSSAGNFSFTGSGNLNLVGVSANVNVTVTRTGNAVAVRGATSVAILGSTVAFTGEFKYDGGTPRVRLAGTANLNMGGFALGATKFSFSNFPDDAGLFAEVHLKAGSAFDANGRLTILGSRFYLGVNATLDVKIRKVAAEAVFTNCTDASCRASAGRTTLNAKAALDVGGFSFGVSVNVASDGAFSATVRSPASGRYYGRTGDIWLLVVGFYADFSYEMELTVSSNSPFISLKGFGRANLYATSWGYRGWFWWGWSDWKHVLGLEASISAPPLRLCGSAYVWGVTFAGCA
jgi:hypothetical protein